MRTNTKRCRRRHSFTGVYCDTCKRNRERNRYWSNPEAQRNRKRETYRKDHPNAHTRVAREAVGSMQDTQIQISINGHPPAQAQEENDCEHNLARQVKPGLFYCFMCDTYLNLDFDPVPAPPEDGESQAGKAQPPTLPKSAGDAEPKPRSKRTRHEQRAAAQQRDESKMVLVRCQHINPKTQEQCKFEWRVWPQNLALVQYCPQLHRAQHKRELNKQRQAAFRQRQKPPT